MQLWHKLVKASGGNPAFTQLGTCATLNKTNKQTIIPNHPLSISLKEKGLLKKLFGKLVCVMWQGK